MTIFHLFVGFTHEQHFGVIHCKAKWQQLIT